MSSLIGQEPSVLHQRLGGGPHGLGDPDDKTLRKVESEVMIPKKMRDKAKIEKCIDEVKEFESCCKESSMLMVVKCREQNEKLRNCLTAWYKDEEFKSLCRNEYLEERSEYRRTGIIRKHRNLIQEELAKSH